MATAEYKRKHFLAKRKGDVMFKFFKGKEKGNVLYAPCKGKVVPLTEVPDPTFHNFLFLKSYWETALQ